MALCSCSALVDVQTWMLKDRSRQCRLRTKRLLYRAITLARESNNNNLVYVKQAREQHTSEGSLQDSINVLMRLFEHGQLSRTIIPVRCRTRELHSDI